MKFKTKNQFSKTNKKKPKSPQNNLKESKSKEFMKPNFQPAQY